MNGRSRNFLFCRAGHATTLLRQRDHVFRPKNCLVFYCIMSAFFVAATSLSLKGHNIYRIFLVNKALFRCCIVVVAELKNCRVPALLFGLIISSFLSYILPVLRPSRTAFVLACIHPVLRPSCPLSGLPCIGSVLHLTCPTSDMSCPRSFLSCICPGLRPSCPASVLSTVQHLDCPTSVLY